MAVRVRRTFIAPSYRNRAVRDCLRCRAMGIDWLDLAAVPGLATAMGRLGMTGIAGAANLERADRVDRLVLFVEDHELAYAGASNIEATLAAQGIELERHPIPDMGVPRDPAAFARLLDETRSAVIGGETAVVACFGGFGRTGTAVSCLLVDAGLTADEAIALTRATRPGTIENASQLRFVHDWRGS